MSLPLINAVPGAGGRSMIFYVDPKTKEINQFSAPTGPESLDRKRRNYDGPVLVTDQGDKEYVTSSSDLAVVSYREVRDGQEVLTIRIYYIGENSRLREIWRDATAPDNTGAWKDGDLNLADIQADNISSLSAFFDNDSRQLRVYHYAPGGAIPSVAFQGDGGKWVSKPIIRFLA